MSGIGRLAVAEAQEKGSDKPDYRNEESLEQAYPVKKAAK